MGSSNLIYSVGR